MTRTTPRPRSTPFAAPVAAARALRAGGVVAYPTEGVWGLGCDPRNRAAMERLLALKRRDPAKGVILLAADLDQLTPFVRLTAEQRAYLSQRWPGPETWVVPARLGMPRWLRGAHPTLAVRVSAHPPAAALARAFGGPVVSTSANRSGRPPLPDARAVRRAFGPAVHVLPGKTGGRDRPTPIRDLATGDALRS